MVEDLAGGRIAGGRLAVESVGAFGQPSLRSWAPTARSASAAATGRAVCSMLTSTVKPRPRSAVALRSIAPVFAGRSWLACSRNSPTPRR